MAKTRSTVASTYLLFFFSFFSKQTNGHGPFLKKALILALDAKNQKRRGGKNRGSVMTKIFYLSIWFALNAFPFDMQIWKDHCKIYMVQFNELKRHRFPRYRTPTISYIHLSSPLNLANETWDDRFCRWQAMEDAAKFSCLFQLY